MAEFQEVMRQFDRMCKAHAGCVDCPLSIKGSVETKCSIGSFIDESEYIEQEIMSWAAEHPEPVYPTWMEWLTDVGAIPKAISWDEPLVEAVYDAIQEHIPADTAQKLGIEPKDG